MSYWRLVLLFCLMPMLVAAQAKVEAVGLRVVKSGIGEHKHELRPFNWMRGTSLAIRVSSEAGGILGIDNEQSKIIYFTDDQGLDLMHADDEPGHFMGQSGFGAFPRVSKDGRAVLFELNAPQVPSEKASALAANGQVLLQVASKFDTETVHGVKLIAGTEIKTTQLAFTVKEAGKPKWGNAAFQLTLETAGDIGLLKSVTFKTADGESVEVRESGTSRSSTNGKDLFGQVYTFKQEHDVLSVQFDIWNDKKSIAVPFDLTVGVGLGDK